MPKSPTIALLWTQNLSYEAKNWVENSHNQILMLSEEKGKKWLTNKYPQIPTKKQYLFMALLWTQD